MSKEIAEEYASSLADLTVNSKPLINMLTILAEENIEHAGAVVDAVEKHLAKVHADIKLPVLYLVDSIIKNVGGAYIQKFSRSIVNMFTRTFKEVNEKVRFQMFKLRGTWRDVFPATKLYQLDVKVNLLDPAWPIPARPPVPSALSPVPSAPVAMVDPVPVPAAARHTPSIPIKQRPSLPVTSGNEAAVASPARVAPVSGALAAARRDPRLLRRAAPAPAPAQPQPPVASSVCATKRKDVITIDGRPDSARRDPRLAKAPDARREQLRAREAARDKRREHDTKPERRSGWASEVIVDTYMEKTVDAKKINKLPPIPKINREANDASLERKKVEVVAFKALRNYPPERSTRRPRARSPRPAPAPAAPSDATNSSEVVKNKDVDLRMLHPAVTEANVAPTGQKRSSPESSEPKSKKSKPDKFDRLFGNEDVDLRKLPQVEENHEEFDAEGQKALKTISIITNQAKEQYSEGQLEKNQYETLMYQVLQLHEKLELKEAKQRESLETSKLKLTAHSHEEVEKIRSPRVSPKGNNFGDMDERGMPAFTEAHAPTDAPNYMQDCDMRMTSVDGPHPTALPRPPVVPACGGPQPPAWRGPCRPRMDDVPQRPRGVVPPYYRGKFARAPRFEPRVPYGQPLPTPRMGTRRGECPPEPYVREATAATPGPAATAAAPVQAKPASAPAPAPAPAVPDINDLFAKLLAAGIIQVPAPTEEAREEPKAEAKKPKEDRTVVHRVDLSRPETLRVKQPALVAKLYGGRPCGGCGARFPPQHPARYSQHLDWHFRQNRRERASARRAPSRPWHCPRADWLQCGEREDEDQRTESWLAPAGRAGGAPAAPPPSVAAGPPARAACALCGDPFLQFYHEAREEWHLSNCVRHEGRNYHPLCRDDYQASLMKKKSPKSELPAAEKADEDAIVIRDVDDTLDQSDDESVVEVIEPEKTFESEEVEPPTDLEAEEDNDVVFKAEPVDELVVDELVVDDCDTDDETTAARGARDHQAQIDFAHVRVKQEPIDPDDEPIVTWEEQLIRVTPDTSRPPVLSSIDGNVQLEAPAQASALPAIRINISKALAPAAPAPRPPPRLASLEDVGADEEVELEYKLKPTLEGVVFSRQPPQQKGTELSGLCSIM